MLALFGNFHNTGSDQTLLPEGNLHKIIDIDLHETTGGTNSCQACQDLQNNTHLKGIHMRMDEGVQRRLFVVSERLRKTWR
jgi:hypothetical protein